MRKLVLISPEDLKEINKELVGETKSNVLSENLLESCFASYLYYDANIERITSVWFSIINNHCFSDGNKRTALVFLILMCKINKINITLTEDELFNIILGIATNKYKDIKEISKLIK